MAHSFNTANMPPMVQGILFGGGLGFTQSILGVTATFTTEPYFIIGSYGIPYMSIILNGFSMTLTFTTFFFVAWHVAGQTGKATTGRAASTWTALFSSIIYVWSMCLSLLFKIDALRMQAQEILDALHIDAQQTYVEVFIGIVLFALLAIFIAVLIGYGIGTIGGKVGQRRFASPVNCG